MGSLEAGIPSTTHAKRDRDSVSAARPRPRSKFGHLRLDYLQWVCSVAVFLLFVVFFTMFLPLPGLNLKDMDMDSMGLLDLGEDVVVGFEPASAKLVQRLRREAAELNHFSAPNLNLNLTLRRFAYRKPLLALVFADLLPDQQQILMTTVAKALLRLGYEIQVFSLEDGPAYDAWNHLGIPVTIIHSDDIKNVGIDWLNFDGVVVTSVEAVGIFSRLLQEPFKSLPLLWTIQDNALAVHLKVYHASGQYELLNNWKKMFNRATAVVFPNYALPMVFSTLGNGNFFVVHGSPAEPLESAKVYYGGNLRKEVGFGSGDFVIAIVGSRFFYKGLWLEHALVLQAIQPLLQKFNDDSASRLRVLIFCGTSSGNYSMAVEAIVQSLKYPRGVVKHIVVDDNVDRFLSQADLVIYGSFLEEKSFPEILIKAMCFAKPIIAPKLSVISKYVEDKVNGFLFAKDNFKALREITTQLISKGKLSPLARDVASNGNVTARNFMVADAVEGYAWLLQAVLRLPSEVARPKSVDELPSEFTKEWVWDLFMTGSGPIYRNRTSSLSFLEKAAVEWNQTRKESSGMITSEEPFVYSVWEDHKYSELAAIRKKREDDEMKDRTDQSHGTWEGVYRNSKKADRAKNDLQERNERELERTGQPLCIYEPFLGEGTWPFLHNSSLYRGIGLSTKGRRPGNDDIDGPSRLPILNDAYYRDVLGDYGAYFSISNRIDRIHKNAWIGFQSWRATARKVNLSTVAETALLNSIQSKKNGDTLYFWVRMDQDRRNPTQQDFWSFCDSVNAGNCKFAIAEALKRMYGFKEGLTELPPMPSDGGTWSVMQSWALPSKSFLEFTMFSRMFVDALDSQMYDKRHQTGYCYLSLSKDKHCYSRVLELLVNIWAYHSARRMVYVDPQSGIMQEQHRLENRKGQMWIKWFSYATLKSMDEDYAEEFDSDRPKKRWLWPLTGEVFWQGVFERENVQRHKQKERRKQKSKEKIERIKKRQHQKALGKYIKPAPEEMGSSNSSSNANSTHVS